MCLFPYECTNGCICHMIYGWYISSSVFLSYENMELSFAIVVEKYNIIRMESNSDKIFTIFFHLFIRRDMVVANVVADMYSCLNTRGWRITDMHCSLANVSIVCGHLNANKHLAFWGRSHNFSQSRTAKFECAPAADGTGSAACQHCNCTRFTANHCRSEVAWKRRNSNWIDVHTIDATKLIKTRESSGCLTFFFGFYMYSAVTFRDRYFFRAGHDCTVCRSCSMQVVSFHSGPLAGRTIRRFRRYIVMVVCRGASLTMTIHKVFDAKQMFFQRIRRLVIIGPRQISVLSIVKCLFEHDSYRFFCAIFKNCCLVTLVTIYLINYANSYDQEEKKNQPEWKKWLQSSSEHASVLYFCACIYFSVNRFGGKMPSHMFIILCACE